MTLGEEPYLDYDIPSHYCLPFHEVKLNLLFKFFSKGEEMTCSSTSDCDLDLE